MKHLRLFFILMALSVNNIKAQISLDASIDSANLIYFFNTVQLSDNETKYYIADTVNNVFNLYNMDFTPFLMNVAVPEPFVDGANTFRAVYITRRLFDCDSTNIEYAYEEASNSNRTFYIMRTDGVQLFRLDSANGPYCFGDCLGGSDWVKPIIKTSAGTKLILQRPYPKGIKIYSLCGYLPSSYAHSMSDMNQSFVKVYPNPSSEQVTFDVIMPNNLEEFELIIFDNNSRERKRQLVNNNSKRFTLEVANYPSGVYYFTLCTKNNSYQNGKFIINK